MNIQGMGRSFYSAIYQGSAGLAASQASSNFDAATIMEEEDTNEDGFLTIDETRLTEEMFASADTDSDDQLSSEELEEMLTAMPSMITGGGMGQGPPPMGGMGAGPMNGSGPGMGPGMGSGMEPPDAASIFEAEDTDDSGTISSDESALPEDVFSSLDTDGDGEISMEELEAAISEKQDEMAGFQPTMASLSTTQQDALAAYQQAMETFMTDYTDGQYTGSNLNEFLEIVA